MHNVKDAMMHLREHQMYPATRAELVAQCNNLSDFSEADKQEFADQLPDRTYQSADEVAEALGWKVTA